jgi:hypothetical protein
MTPLVLFLLGVAAVYVSTVTTAFSALMRLSLRLMAERSGRHDALGRYLEEPLRLFIPGRRCRPRPAAARALDGDVRPRVRAPGAAGARAA